MNTENLEIELSNQALKYFEKRLLLSENINELDEIEAVPQTGIIEDSTNQSVAVAGSPNHEDTPDSEFIDASTAIDDAKEILGNFPIDKSRFSPEREYIVQGSMFDECIEADKILNSLLFATKLAFFDVSSNESSIIREVSEDSFGYMNILRHNQIKILDSEVKKIKNKINYLKDDAFLTNIDLLKDYKEQDSESLRAYLDAIINFYALNVMNNPSKDNKVLINDWLNKKLGDKR